MEAVTKRFESMIPQEARNVDGTPMKDHPAYKKVKEQYDTAIKNVQKGYEANNQDRIQQHKKVIDEMPPDWWNTAADKRIAWYICGSIGANWQGPCPEDHSKRCDEREKCLSAGGGNQCFQYFQEVCYFSSLKQKRKRMEEAVTECEKKYKRQASAQVKNSFPLPNAPAQPKITPPPPKPSTPAPKK